MRPWLAFAISRNWSAIQARAANTPRWPPSFSENVLRVPNPTSFVSAALSRSAETLATMAAIAGSGAGAACDTAAAVRHARTAKIVRILPPKCDESQSSTDARRGGPKEFHFRPPSLPPRGHDVASSTTEPEPRKGASMASERDYVLGTHDEEIERL